MTAAGPPGPPPASRRREKSAAAFRTISEAAAELDVPQHVLRFWETKFSQVRPLKRAGGRRYYRPEDIELLRRIRDLLYTDGYTIKGAQKVLREGGARRRESPAESRAGTAADAPAAEEEVARPATATAPTGEAAAPAPDRGDSAREEEIRRLRAELESVLGELSEMRALIQRVLR